MHLASTNAPPHLRPYLLPQAVKVSSFTHIIHLVGRGREREEKGEREGEGERERGRQRQREGEGKEVVSQTYTTVDVHCKS